MSALKSAARTFVVVVAVLAPYLFATSPTPAPYDQFSVQGNITRPSGNSLENFSVVLLAKGRTSGGTFQILKGRGEQYDRPVSLTDSTGAFSILVSTYEKTDSLALGVVVPDRPITRGATIALSDVRPFEQTETRTTYDDATCSGCTSPVDKVSTIIVAYRYSLPMQVVALDW
jgi:hypothetical protein